MAGGVSRTRFWYLFLVFTSYEGLTRCPHRRPMPPPGASPPVLVTREQGRTPGGLVCSARLAGGRAPATPPEPSPPPATGQTEVPRQKDESTALGAPPWASHSPGPHALCCLRLSALGATSVCSGGRGKGGFARRPAAPFGSTVTVPSPQPL